EALADHLVDGGLDKSGRNRLAVPVAIRIIGYRRKVGHHVVHELLEFILQSLRALGFSADIPGQLFGGVQRPRWAFARRKVRKHSSIWSGASCSSVGRPLIACDN